MAFFLNSLYSYNATIQHTNMHNFTWVRKLIENVPNIMATSQS